MTGRSLGVMNGNCYISQVNFTVQKTSSTVQCVHNTDSDPIEIGESYITAVSGIVASACTYLIKGRYY